MRALRILLALVTTGTLAAACSGGDGGGGGGGIDPGQPPGGTLTTGDYEITDWDGGTDGCRSNSSLVGNQVGIAVDGTALQWGTTGIGGPTPGVIYGSSFTVTTAPDVLDFTTQPYPYGIGPYDCVLELEQSFVGLAHGNDRALVDRVATVSPTSGAECDDVEDEVSDLANGSISFPCTSEAQFLIEKL